MTGETPEDLERMLQPLLSVLRSGRHLRVVGRPNAVSADRPEGGAQVAVSWEREEHEAALEQLREPRVLSDGCTAVAVADAVVVRRAPDPVRRLDDLASEGRLSSLAARMLDAAQANGRNILVAGPWCAAAELIGALLSTAKRPALIGPRGEAAPPVWPLLSDVASVRILGPDRLGCWSLEAEELVELMACCRGVAAWIDAARLDQALIRYEAALERIAPSATAPLQVLGAIDLVVVLTEAGGVRVREIAEIGISEEGYRPRLLFSRDVPPVPSALVPVAAPSFLQELAQAGLSVLANELRHAAGDGPAAVDTASPPPASPPPAAEMDTTEPAFAPQPPAARPAAERTPPTPPPPRLDPNLADAEPPGWELDQLEDTPALAPSQPAKTAEDAVMEASFGLGPPPPPPGVAPIGPEVVQGLAENGGAHFEDAMKRAKERDDELRQENGEDD